MQQFIRQLIPFLLTGIAIVAFAFGIMLLAYLFLFGAIIGFVLYLAAIIREKFFQFRTNKPIQRSQGRTIDSDNWKKW